MSKVAVLVGPEFEDSELEIPVKRLLDAGHQVVLLGTEANQELVGKKGRVKLLTDGAVSNHRVDEFDALVIPGGKSPAHLREDATVVRFVEDFCRMGRPVAAICHGPQLLIAAGQGRGRRMTAYKDVQAELREFGAEAVDEGVVVDGAFITSRTPEDLNLFCGALLSRVGAMEEDQKAPVRAV
jgi:protease I